MIHCFECHPKDFEIKLVSIQPSYRTEVFSIYTSYPGVYMVSKNTNENKKLKYMSRQ